MVPVLRLSSYVSSEGKVVSHSLTDGDFDRKRLKTGLVRPFTDFIELTRWIWNSREIRWVSSTDKLTSTSSKHKNEVVTDFGVDNLRKRAWKTTRKPLTSYFNSQFFIIIKFCFRCFWKFGASVCYRYTRHNQLTDSLSSKCTTHRSRVYRLSIYWGFCQSILLERR